MRFLLILLLSGSALLGQVIPGRFVVELAEPPLGALARAGAVSLERSDRLTRIASQQRTAARLIEDRGGRVVSSVNAVMNALLVQAADADAPWLQTLPGAMKVYPVETVRLGLDHALPLHFVPQAWSAIGGRERAGAGIKIAILDTGIAYGHPGFQDAALQIPPGYPLASPAGNLQFTSGKIIVARDYREFYPERFSEDVRDRDGHGTAVAMCAAGVPHQAPFGYLSGVAPKAWLGIYKTAPSRAGGIAGDAILKAVDDALADGMDVLNLSAGSPLATTVEESATATGLDRAARFGMVVVVAAGNDGPAPATISNFGSIPSVISVGASSNDRTLNAAVEASGVDAQPALPRSGALPAAPVSGPLRDIQPADGCSALAQASLARAVALVPRGGCTFEQKFNNLAAAGAVAAVVWLTSATDPVVVMDPGRATLPAVMVDFASGGALRTAAQKPDAAARVSFDGVAFPLDPSRTLGFSSRGPTYSYQVKPDLTATGYVYTATQSLNPDGDSYSTNGYIEISGTSFSSPITAGAAALLRAARPGLSVNQYRSLLINRSGPMDVKGSGLERVQNTGTGVLNLQNSLSGTVTADPTSVSFGIGPGTAELFETFTLTNIGTREDTYTIRGIPYDGATLLQFADNARGLGAAETVTLKLSPQQSKPVYVSWRFEKAAAAQYQGQIAVQGTADGAALLVPYWYAVPSGTPYQVSVPAPPPVRIPAGQETTVYFRVLDDVGIPVTDAADLQYQGTVVEGGGSIGPARASGSYPGTVFVVLRTGPSPGRNVYRVEFGKVSPLTLTIQGVQPGN